MAAPAEPQRRLRRLAAWGLLACACGVLPVRAQPPEPAPREGLRDAAAAVFAAGSAEWAGLGAWLKEHALERGGASWYGLHFHKRRTASGELFDMGALTAAHRTLPFGTRVCVHSLANGREVLVRINDRGPHLRSRVIDLSRAAAEALGMGGMGVKEVALSLPAETGRPCGVLQSTNDFNTLE